MSFGYDYNPANYPAGSDLFVSSRIGWTTRDVVRYVVDRHTPKGQVIATRTFSNGETDTIRITPRGDLVGDGRYGRRQVVSREEALEIRAEQRRQQVWRQARSVAEAIDKAARDKDTDALARTALELTAICKEVGAVLAQGMEAATAGETGSVADGLDAKHDSAVGA